MRKTEKIRRQIIGESEDFRKSWHCAGWLSHDDLAETFNKYFDKLDKLFPKMKSSNICYFIEKNCVKDSPLRDQARSFGDDYKRIESEVRK